MVLYPLGMEPCAHNARKSLVIACLLCAVCQDTLVQIHN